MKGDERAAEFFGSTVLPSLAGAASAASLPGLDASWDGSVALCRVAHPMPQARNGTGAKQRPPAQLQHRVGRSEGGTGVLSQCRGAAVCNALLRVPHLTQAVPAHPKEKRFAHCH